MRFAFLAFSLFIGHALAAQTNPDYDPDFDGNGCYTVLDILSFLVILMPDDAGMDSPNPDYDADYDDNGELTVMDLTGMLTWFGECAPTLLCESPTMDGHSYAVVTIGDQCWFAENLRTTVYGNGDLIPDGLTDGEWASTSAGATAVYGEGSSSCSNLSPDIDACDDAQSLAEYGRLYNWYAVDDARGLCPVGWHVPTDEEWTDLESHIASQGFSGSEATALKSTNGWRIDIPEIETSGSDDFGFVGLPSGFRTIGGEFATAGGDCNLWTASNFNGGAWFRILNWSYSFIIRDNLWDSASGASVRCLRDAE